MCRGKVQGGLGLGTEPAHKDELKYCVHSVSETRAVFKIIRRWAQLPRLCFFLVNTFPFQSCLERVIIQLPTWTQEGTQEVCPGCSWRGGGAASSLSLRLVLLLCQSGQQHCTNGSSPFPVVRAAANPALPHLENPVHQNQSILIVCQGIGTSKPI